MDDKKAKEEAQRARDNRELIRRMNAGESLTRYDNSSSWFPPRPIIKKDEKTLEFIHKSQTTAKKRDEKQSSKSTESNIEEKPKHLKLV